MIKIALGSGNVYKPGYVNIDKFQNPVVDKVCDASDLPFEPNSIELIEASQLIEHFDAIHCKYVLSEWFRVLKPQGTLIIETPDLQKTFKKFLSSSVKTRKKTLQWIYGIQSPGMQHKTGFSFQLLRDLLKEVGFVKIVRKKPRTHTYEPGIRVVCRKPTDCAKERFHARYRKRLKNQLTDDSLLLIPLEDWLEKIFNSYSTLKELKANSKLLNEILSKTVLCQPYVPLAFLKECISCGIWEKEDVKGQLDLLHQFADAEIHKKLFTLWIKRKKRAGNIKEEFESFIKHATALMRETFSDGNLQRMNYLLSLEATNIELFDFQIISLHAKRLFNIGVKKFHNGKLSGALDSTVQSAKILPKNPLAHWNIARLRSILGQRKDKILPVYHQAFNLMKNKKNRERIKKELNHINNDKRNLIEKEPVSEAYRID
ncbi:MAG: methyltransferase domain-containing protein [Candidatus Korarchaeota archaeon]|nr:methyltransferase domain-containing protein [Candidatus Korarchaeota archaeon]NIU82383.1 methyltransferase domain-containing protein [Candidatus Thorarchaeota archaeon]NIW12850.1 methyltransferase domain-containing protein [Candidatus Thorarchaeota archaeon]NIW51051.1 methyltransferase domain-containing protein [Candidatus Korarchaeota archaeon]